MSGTALILHFESLERLLDDITAIKNIKSFDLTSFSD